MCPGSYTHVQVSLDGRYEVAYPTQLFDEHESFWQAEGEWWQMLEKYPTDAVLIPQGYPLAPVFRECLNRQPKVEKWAQSWRIVYEDRSYLVIAKQGTDLQFTGKITQSLPNATWQTLAGPHTRWQWTGM